MTNVNVRIKHLDGQTRDGGFVKGEFLFDGRTKADQTGTFALVGTDLNFMVKTMRKGNKIRKEMKACAQKDQILEQLRNEIQNELGTDDAAVVAGTVLDGWKDIPLQPEQAEPVEEFGVDKEREIAEACAALGEGMADAAKRAKADQAKAKLEAAHARSNKLIGTAMIKDPELRRWANNAIDKAEGRVPVEAAMGKDHEDLLEIPEFLKRS